MLRTVFAAILALAASAASADLVATTKTGDELRLTMAACTHEGIRARIKDEYRNDFRAGVATVGGKRFEACWVDTRDGYYYTVFDDGDVSAYPITAFISSPGV